MAKYRFAAIAAAAILGSAAISPPVAANVLLTRADIKALLNRVELLPRGRSSRPARLSDYLGLGDGLRTATASRAELRFNDGSLARLGEHAAFSFIPNTRTFSLSNGTVLLLIPPGQGRTTIRTPNAVTGIQGSALIVRHVEARDLTLVMALTNNPTGPMTITLNDQAQEVQEVALSAGQMALVQQGTVQVVEFDLKAFYETSNLVDDLDLTDESQAENDALLAPVRREILEALHQQPGFSADSGVLDPSLIRPEAAVSSTPSLEQTVGLGDPNTLALPAAAGGLGNPGSLGNSGIGLDVGIPGIGIGAGATMAPPDGKPPNLGIEIETTTTPPATAPSPGNPTEIPATPPNLERPDDDFNPPSRED